MAKRRNRKSTPGEVKRPPVTARAPGYPSGGPSRSAIANMPEPAGSAPARPTSPTPSEFLPLDETLLERANTQWRFGDWEGLAEIDLEALHHHPDRAKLALLAAEGHLQLGQLPRARALLKEAQAWGVAPKTIHRVLIAGVYNTLGKASFLKGQVHEAMDHFSTSVRIAMPGAEHRMSTKARALQQVEQLVAGASDAGEFVLGVGEFAEALLPRPLAEQLSLRHGSPQIRAGRPAPPVAARLDSVHAVLAFIHETLQPKMYLEIGVHEGKSLALATGQALGIDPVPRQRDHLGSATKVVTATSNEFFLFLAEEELREPPDLVFIDGMPLIEYVLRDFIHCERHAKPTTLLAIANVFPRTAEQGMRHRTGPNWAGDAWKLPGLLKAHRSELFMLPLDVGEHGLLLVGGLDPENTAFTGHEHVSGVRLAERDVHTPPPSEVLAREGSALATHPVVAELLSVISGLATQEAPAPDEVRQALQATLSRAAQEH